MTTTAISYAAHAAKAPLERTEISRRDPGPTDVAIDIDYSGICHSDIHTVRDEWGAATYPVVPGHEIIGTVTAVGGDVTRFAPGDRVGVGVIVESCRACESCLAGEENYCARGPVGTYGGLLASGEFTQGGYATSIVTDDHFVYRIPGALDPAAAAPLLCAGITTYSPLRHWEAGPGTRVAIIGLGGLGHLGVKFAAALGAEVTVLSQSLSKRDAGLAMGASDYFATSDRETFRKNRRRFDLVINTVSANLDLNDYLRMVAKDGTFVEVGLPEHPLSVTGQSLVNGRVSLSGSMIGGVPETQQMLDFAGEHGITADIELIPASEINTAFDRVVASDVRFRFVIDMASLR
ncbi:NAD(P)-dependent alcohol dehydrogenase [Millisia brevis]|uniref:NAD(P)-dependent alcohol dehydrogenase n=1 Tax=Millisia brevis TaxID=264148 RepID=UPI00082DA1F5|nr:NAD(P)-dependent alcohol dehydrogenase [Millisia brevis]